MLQHRFCLIADKLTWLGMMVSKQCEVFVGGSASRGRMVAIVSHGAQHGSIGYCAIGGF